MGEYNRSAITQHEGLIKPDQEADEGAGPIKAHISVGTAEVSLNTDGVDTKTNDDFEEDRGVKSLEGAIKVSIVFLPSMGVAELITDWMVVVALLEL